MDKLKTLPFEDIGEAMIDHHRPLRKGFPEVIFGEGKDAEQVITIMERMAEAQENILVTRIEEKKAKAVLQRFPQATYHRRARAITVRIGEGEERGKGIILVISAGTSDIPVAEEAAVTARIMGNEVETLYDVGVSGIHRLLNYREKLLEANVLIVVAGMEGALPSVVGGLVARPVIAVPTSVGYGTSFGGLAPLLAMLNSCASNVAVVNIDNGFGAGYVACLINR
jgi:NCAIR mutase (PurE)-related protein